MMASRFMLAVALSLLFSLAGCLEVSLSVSKVELEQATLAKAIDAETGLPLGSDTVFEPTDTIYCFVRFKERTDATIEFLWYYEEEVSYRQMVRIDVEGSVWVQPSQPEGLPTGHYRVEILHLSTVLASVPFVVQ